MNAFAARVTATLLTVALAGCTPASGSTGTSSTQVQGGPDGRFELPDLTDCSALAGLVADYVDGIPLNTEQSSVASHQIYCDWSPRDDRDPMFSIQVDPEGDPASPDADADTTRETTFTDPRLSAVNGVGVWQQQSDDFRGGSVVLPGLTVMIAQSGKTSTPLTRDALVSLALGVLQR